MLTRLDKIPFERRYAELPDILYSEVEPTPVADPELFWLNRPLARELGLDPEALASPEGTALLAGNLVPKSVRPLAMGYAGHQFGGWVPQLGDGRALLLGELVDARGVRRDVQLKGSGRTPYSRRGDGRSSIGPVVREVLGSEAMAALGIPTTRALAAVATGERVFRERPEPGGVMTRVAESHIRVGTFEFALRRGGTEAVRALLEHVIARHYPELAEGGQAAGEGSEGRADPAGRADSGGMAEPGGTADFERTGALLEAVTRRTAELVAQWLLVGFIHGVMNTDNTSVAGLTIDYGPFGFLDPYRPSEVYSSIDVHGRYAYNRQPGIALWNLARFAETLLPFLGATQDEGVERAQAVLGGFVPHFEGVYHRGLARKLGFAEEREGDRELAIEFLDRMERDGADYTNTFRALCHVGGTDAGESGADPGAASGGASARASGEAGGSGTVSDEDMEAHFGTPGAFAEWAPRWRARLAAEGRAEADRRRAMRAVNPAYILRNHLAQAAVDAAIERLDFEPMKRLLGVLARPFEEQPGAEDLARAPEPEERVTRTFCGT